MPAVSPPSPLVALVEALAAGDLAPSILLVTGLHRSDVELAVRPASPEGVVLDLHGVLAPDHVDAVVVITGATAHHLDHPGRRDRIRAVVALGRDGSSASVLTPPGSLIATGPDDAPVGHLADAMRRVLGLPTPPPPVPVDHLHARLWADRVLAAVLAGESVDRRRVRALQPGPSRSWADVRTACAAGAWGELGVDPEVAGWMDDGTFARWVLAELPDAVEVVLELADLLPPDALGPLLSMVYWTGPSPTDLGSRC